jgi:hypothetical protein
VQWQIGQACLPRNAITRHQKRPYKPPAFNMTPWRRSCACARCTSPDTC